MQEVETLASVLWWVFPLTLLCAAGCFVAGLGHGWWAYWLWKTRDLPTNDTRLAKMLEGIKPPPYKLYAAFWFVAGALMVVAAFMLRP